MSVCQHTVLSFDALQRFLVTMLKPPALHVTTLLVLAEACVGDVVPPYPGNVCPVVTVMAAYLTHAPWGVALLAFRLSLFVYKHQRMNTVER